MDFHKEIDFKDFITIRSFSIATLALSLVWLILLLSDSTSQKDFFFLNCEDNIADFCKPMQWHKENRLYTGKSPNYAKEHCYPPVGMIFFKPFLKIADSINNNAPQARAFVATVSFYFLIFVFLSLINYQLQTYPFLDRALFNCAIFFSGIFMFFMERGNIIILTVTCLAFYLFFHDSTNKIIKECTLLALAIAFAMKLTPAIFGILLLYKKEYAAACRAGIYAILISMAGFLFIDGSISDNFLIISQNIKSLMTMTGLYENSFDRLTIMSFLDAVINGFFQLNLNYAQLYYTVMRPGLVVIFAIIFFSDFLHDVWWRKTLHCALAAILLPTLAYQYTALYLIPPLILFLKHPNKNKTDQLYFIYFILLLSPIKWGSSIGTLLSEIVWFMLLENLLVALYTICQKYRHHELQLKKLVSWIPFRNSPQQGLWYLANFILLFSAFGLLVLRPTPISEEAIFTSEIGKVKYNYSGTWNPKSDGINLICDFVPVASKQTQNIFQIGEGKNSIHLLVSSVQEPNEISLIFYSDDKLKRNNIWLPNLKTGNLYRLLLTTCGNTCVVNLFIFAPAMKSWLSLYDFSTWQPNNFNIKKITLGSQQSDLCPFAGQNLRFGLFKQSYRHWTYWAGVPGMLWLLLLIIPMLPIRKNKQKPFETAKI